MAKQPKNLGRLRALPNSELYQEYRPAGEIERMMRQKKAFENVEPLSKAPACVSGDLSLNEWNDTFPITREELRERMITHSLKGFKMLKKRMPYTASTVEFSSPDDTSVKFRIKKIGNRELIAYRDRDALIRYTTRNGDSGEEYISEKEYPRGSNQLDTILLCLSGWDIADPNTNQELAITRDTLIDYLSTEELDFLFDQCFEVNPVLSGIAGRKKSLESGPSAPVGSTPTQDEPSGVHPVVSE